MTTKSEITKSEPTKSMPNELGSNKSDSFEDQVSLKNLRGRIEKYLKARRGHHFFFSEDGKNVFFLNEVNEKSLLHRLDLDKSCDLDQSDVLMNYDFSQNTFEIVDYRVDENALYLSLDEKNTEFTNYYKLDLNLLPKASELERLTNVKMARNFKWNSDKSKFYFLDRRPTEKGLFESTLYCYDQKQKTTQALFSDQLWKYRIGWGDFYFDANGEHVFLQVDEQCRREKFNVYKVDLERYRQSPMAECLEPAKILPESIELGNPYLISSPKKVGSDWLFVLMSTHSGFDNFYSFRSGSSGVISLTQETWQNVTMKSVQTIQTTDSPMKKVAILCAPDKTKLETRVALLNLENLKVDIKVFKGNFTMFEGAVTPVLRQSAIDLPPCFYLLDSNMDVQKSISTYVGEVQDLVQGRYEVVSYKSFDGLEIHANLILPKKPIVAAMVLAFYGGENYYDFATQLYLEAGIAILSPAVRGSWGWGQVWEDYLKMDLGGGEILDVIWGAKYLKEVLQLPERKIGVFGASHGGYAVLRTLTMPKNFRGAKAEFNFGFGICECGFADLEDFYKTSRIADWLVDLLGPYPQNQVLYRERSPLHFFENLKAPLFVRHGTSDSRVPLSTMQIFIEKLKKSGLKYEIMIQENQGHHAQNISIITEEKSRVFEFLSKVGIVG